MGGIGKKLPVPLHLKGTLSRLLSCMGMGSVAGNIHTLLEFNKLHPDTFYFLMQLQSCLHPTGEPEHYVRAFTEVKGPVWDPFWMVESSESLVCIGEIYNLIL